MKAQSAALVGSRLLGVMLQAVTVILLGRAVGPAEFGMVGLALGVLAVLATLADFGASSLLLRARARQDTAVEMGLRRLNAISTLLLMSLSVLASILASAFGGAQWPVALAFLALAVSIEKNADTLLSVPIADGRVAAPALNIVLRRGVGLGCYLVLTLLWPPLPAYTISITVGAALGWLHVRRLVGGGRSDETTQPISMIELIKLTSPFLWSNVSSQARSLDVPLVFVVSGATVAGIYSAGLRLANPLVVISNALAASALPVATRERERVRALAANMVALHFALILLMSPFAFFGTQIMIVLFGSEFAAAGPVLSVLLLGLPVVGLSSVLGAIVQGVDGDKFVAVNGIVFMFVILVGVAVGAVLAGAVGAAIGLSLGYLLKCVSLFVPVYREGGKWWR